MRVFLTGGTGYIGSYIALELADAGHQVTILARNPDKVQALARRPEISFIQGSLDDLDLIRSSLPGHEVCIHNAIYWEEEPTELELKDTRASNAIFEAAGEAGLQQVIYASSVGVHRPFTSDMNEEARIQPADFYGATKACGEMFLAAFSHQYTTRFNIIRPGPTIGVPVERSIKANSHSRFREMVLAARSGEDIKVLKGDGRQFVKAGDLARLYRAVLESDKNGETYLCLAADFTTWEAIANVTVGALNSKSRVIVEPFHGHQPPPSFDVSKIDRHFGLVFEAGSAIEEHIDDLSRSMS